MISGCSVNWALKLESFRPLSQVSSWAISTIMIPLVCCISWDLTIRKPKGLFFVLRLRIEVTIKVSCLWRVVLFVSGKDTSLREVVVDLVWFSLLTAQPAAFSEEFFVGRHYILQSLFEFVIVFLLIWLYFHWFFWARAKMLGRERTQFLFLGLFSWHLSLEALLWAWLRILELPTILHLFFCYWGRLLSHPLHWRLNLSHSLRHELGTVCHAHLSRWLIIIFDMLRSLRTMLRLILLRCVWSPFLQSCSTEISVSVWWIIKSCCTTNSRCRHLPELCERVWRSAHFNFIFWTKL